ncbi:MAG: DNA-3-methyladenine glycosylase 2 family protein [Pseudomonadota bacterium]|nr:DNA-3-methyladenine glycosylase 2 family protein [Pseudomonadota bacterium]
MGLSNAQLRDHLDAVAAEDPVVAGALKRCGYPEERIRPTGYRTLLRTIVGQQVSVASADAVWGKLEAELGEDMQADELLARDFDTLRACGLSRQKQGYARSLCELVTSNELDLASLPADDEEAIAELVRIKGIGRWSAEIYLLFAEGRPDIWPAGDLAVQEAVGRMLTLPARPSEKETREIGARWQPHRGAMAIFTWHAYTNAAL